MFVCGIYYNTIRSLCYLSSSHTAWLSIETTINRTTWLYTLARYNVVCPDTRV
jgi:hypothetical protein